MLIVFLDQALVHDILVYQEIACSCINTKLGALLEKHLSTSKIQETSHAAALNFVHTSGPGVSVLNIVIMIF
jgi:hypothetical protein